MEVQGSCICLRIARISAAATEALLPGEERVVEMSIRVHVVKSTRFKNYLMTETGTGRVDDVDKCGSH